MDIDYLNKLNESGDLKKLFMMGLIKAEVFTYIELKNKYESIKVFIKKDSTRRNLMKRYFNYSKCHIDRILKQFDN